MHQLPHNTDVMSIPLTKRSNSSTNVDSHEGEYQTLSNENSDTGCMKSSVLNATINDSSLRLKNSTDVESTDFIPVPHRKQTRVRVNKGNCLARRADLAYIALLSVLCVIVLVGTGIYFRMFLLGCWPCVVYESQGYKYLDLGGPLAVIPGPTRALAAGTSSCAIENGSTYDTILVSGKESGDTYGYLKLVNGPGTQDSERTLISAQDQLLLTPDSLIIDVCTADVYIADSHEGSIFRLTCNDESSSVSSQLCSEYLTTFVELDKVPLALAALPSCNQLDSFHFFVAGVRTFVFCIYIYIYIYMRQFSEINFRLMIPCGIFCSSSPYVIVLSYVVPFCVGGFILSHTFFLHCLHVFHRMREIATRLLFKG